MPIKEQMQTVIDNLKKVIPQAPDTANLDMMETQLGEACGTVHCLAGWYAIATCPVITHTTNFYVGVINMAMDLGFTDSRHIIQWAMCNRYTWGNASGESMFTSKMAFYNPTKRPDGAKTLQHIVDHLEEVRDRLPV